MSRSWMFGDGGSSNAMNPNHTYAAAGTYSVVLTVTDDGDASDSETQSVTVTDGTPVSLTLQAEPGQNGGSRNFVDLTWTNANTADIYRDGDLIATSSGSCTDNTKTRESGFSSPTRSACRVRPQPVRPIRQ